MTVVFRCSPSQMFGYTDARYNSADQQLTIRDYRFSNGYFAIGASVLGLLTVLALALPAVKRFEIGKSALCRLSFEPLSCIGVAWLGICLLYTSFVCSDSDSGHCQRGNDIVAYGGHLR